MEDKNKAVIQDLEREEAKLKGVREYLAGHYNNDMNKDACKIIRHAENVLKDYADSLK